MNVDDLYVAIILTLSDAEVQSLPKGVSMEELARRFPETYEKCAETVRSQFIAKSSISPAKCLDSSDGT